jgi:hypothetical protein
MELKQRSLDETIRTRMISTKEERDYEEKEEQWLNSERF